VSLLNTIIKDRLQSKGKKSSRGYVLRSIGSSTGTGTDTDSVEMNVEIEDVDNIRKLSNASIGLLNKLRRNWDKELISSIQGRKKWENVLIGFLYDVRF